MADSNLTKLLQVSQTPTLYFDYDGTLHNSIKIYEPAFRKAYRWLVHKGFAEERMITSEEISGWLGLSKMEMWSTFMPNLPEAVTGQAGKIIGDTMIELVHEGQAELYPNTTKTLSSLKAQGFTLVMVSNCSISYMAAMREVFHLDHWFTAYYVAESFDWQPKEIFLKKAIEAYGAPAVMIGDRHKDVSAGKKNKAVTVGCTYGYGRAEELMDADCLISTIDALFFDKSAL